MGHVKIGNFSCENAFRTKLIPGLSAFVITRNEADRIERCLRSILPSAEEVVLVDCGSTDEKISRASKLGARVVHNDWAGYGPQKRFAEEQCRNDWLLNLDADEVLTPALDREIRALFDRGEPQASFFQVSVEEVLPGRKKPSKRCRIYRIVRLYDRRKSRYLPHPIHDRVKVPKGCKVETLQGTVLHYSFRSILQMVAK